MTTHGPERGCDCWRKSIFAQIIGGIVVSALLGGAYLWKGAVTKEDVTAAIRTNVQYPWDREGPVVIERIRRNTDDIKENKEGLKVVNSKLSEIEDNVRDTKALANETKNAVDRIEKKIGTTHP